MLYVFPPGSYVRGWGGAGDPHMRVGKASTCGCLGVAPPVLGTGERPVVEDVLEVVADLETIYIYIYIYIYISIYLSIYQMCKPLYYIRGLNVGCF
jgi:hypothetical protein